MVLRTIKIGFYIGFNGFIYFGTIMLIPTIYKDINFANATTLCNGALQGYHYLVIAIVFGVSNILGQLLAYLIGNILKTGLKIGMTSLSCMIAYVIMVYYSEDYFLLVSFFAVLQLLLGACSSQALLLASDHVFFDQNYLKSCIVISEVLYVVALLVSNIVTISFQHITVLKIHLAMSIITFFSSITFFIKR